MKVGDLIETSQGYGVVEMVAGDYVAVWGSPVWFLIQDVVLLNQAIKVNYELF